jgi:hypothetical protein
MPDEAIYAERAVAFWQHGSLPLLHGQGAGYGVLYPVLAGFPLSVGNFETGYASLKLLQALVMSLAAVPVFFYGRRLVATRYALLAAALTVASPLLLYSGLVMTEVLFYPVATLALLAAARAVSAPTLSNQALALVLVLASTLVRVQAVVFVAVLAGAIVVDATLARDWAKLRSFWPTWLALVAAGVATATVPALFGSYAGTLRGSYPVGDALGLSFDHLAYLVLSTGILPVAALVLLLARAARGDEQDPAARALLAVAACAVVLVVLQVGFFAARYSPHLLGRDLAALPPLLFISFAVWVERGASRPARAMAAFGVLALLLLAPWNHLVAANALPDTFDIAVLYRLHSVSPVTVVTVGAVVSLLAFALVPRRAVLVLPLLVLAALTANSVVADNEIKGLVDTSRAEVVGSPANWIDRAADGGVTYLYDGESYWNGVWQERFWNRRIDRILSVRPASVPGPLGQTEISVPPNGLLPTRDRYIVATDRHTFFGTPVAQLAPTGLTLWRLDGPTRLSTSESGVLPNGDIVGPATINVYDCRNGRLELTLLPKATKTVQILLDHQPVLRQAISGEAAHVAVSVPPSSKPRVCSFTVVPEQLLGSTRIAFVRS